MSTLTGTKIKDTYPGLIKTTDNAAVDPTVLKQLTDGTGGSLNISVSQVETKFASGSLVDFTGVSVLGLASAGLIAGSTANSMISAPSLTTTAAAVLAPNAIALGDNARGGGYAAANHAIAIGTDAYAEGEQAVTLGKNAWSQSQNCIALGTDSHARLADSISIGRSSQAADTEAIAIGYDSQTGFGGQQAVAVGKNANAGAAQSIAIGNNSTSSNAQTIAIGNSALANNFQSVALGDGAEATGIGAAAVGQYAEASATYSSAWGRTSYARSEGSVAFGQQAGVPFSPTGTEYIGAVAMGRQVVADTADTTHVRALKIVAPDGGTGGNGITMLSPNGTEGVITLTNASELAVDGTPIGGGAVTTFSTSRVSETQATSSCDTIRASVLIPANTYAAGDILDVSAVQSLSGSNGTTYAELWISTVGTVGSAPTGENVAQIHSSTDGTGKFNKTLYVNAASGTGGTEFIENGINNEAGLPPTAMQGSSVVTAGTIDWTVDQYLAIKVCIDNTGATWTNYGAVIRKIN